MVTAAILSLLLWKPVYYIGYLHFYKKETEALAKVKNYALGLWDLVKPSAL